MNEPRQTIRLDKWLWMARFFKTRRLATDLVAAGKVRIDGTPVSKPARAVGVGDVLTFPQAKQIRIVRITGLPDRRGPAPEAQALYDDLTPKVEKSPEQHSQNPRFEGKGRPTGKERRNMASHLRDSDR